MYPLYPPVPPPMLATVCFVLILCKADSQTSGDGDVDADLQQWHRCIRRNIKLFGIVPFYFAILVFDVFCLIAVWTCTDTWWACDSDEVRFEHITNLIFPVARSVYLFVEMIACVQFNGAHMFQNTLVLAGLAVVQATNVSTWLDALLHESTVFQFENNWTYELSRCFNGSDVNVSDHVVRCFSRTTGEYKMLHIFSPYLYPFIMEYLMLVIECVADWFFSDAGRHDGTPPPMSRLQSIASTANNADGGTEQAPTTSDVEQHQQPQHGLEATATRAFLSDSDIAPETRREPCDRCPCFFILFVLSLIPSFLYLIFGTCELFLANDEYRQSEYGYIFTIYQIIYWIFLLLAALVGYTASLEFHCGPMNPTGFEYFVILSCIGPIMLNIISIVANFQDDDNGVLTSISFTEEVTYILHICTQSAFYAYAKRIQIRTFADDENADRELRRKRSILMGVISYFAVCNATLWLEDSFIETRGSETSWQNQYFDEWPVIYNIFNPLSLMFRFNSFLLFLNVLFDKRQQLVHS